MLTTKNDLRGGRSVWADSAHIALRSRSLLQEETCDIAVVGAGVSGALVTLTLAEDGHDVVVLDRRSPLRGSTVASTAMIQFELDTPLTRLAEKIRPRAAERAYRRSFRAVKNLGQLILRHQIACAWTEREALYLAGDAMGWRALQTEATYRAKIGLPSQFVPAAALAQKFGIEKTGAILSQGAADLNPAQLTAGCLRAARRFGARLYTPQDVVNVEASRDGVRLTTASGGIVAARRVIFATGYEVAPGIPAGDYDIISSWAIATKPLLTQALWPTRCLIWEASDPYLYLRTTADNRIVAGGEDSGVTDPDRRDRAIPKKAARLLAKICDLLPGRDFKIDYAWAGAFADSPTGLPHIATIDGMPNGFAILGCGGNGITFSMVAAEMARHWARGKRDPDADLFESNRGDA
jgi:glycine/D-amino acid oxidase-like deaminating enzyme